MIPRRRWPLSACTSPAWLLCWWSCLWDDDDDEVRVVCLAVLPLVAAVELLSPDCIRLFHVPAPPRCGDCVPPDSAPDLDVDCLPSRGRDRWPDISESEKGTPPSAVAAVLMCSRCLSRRARSSSSKHQRITSISIHAGPEHWNLLLLEILAVSFSLLLTPSPAVCHYSHKTLWLRRGFDVCGRRDFTDHSPRCIRSTSVSKYFVFVFLLISQDRSYAVSGEINPENIFSSFGNYFKDLKI